MLGEEPKGQLLRRRHVLEWLGISRNIFLKWKECGLLHPVNIDGGNPFYLKSDLLKLVERARNGRKGTN